MPDSVAYKVVGTVSVSDVSIELVVVDCGFNKRTPRAGDVSDEVLVSPTTEEVDAASVLVSAKSSLEGSSVNESNPLGLF